MSDQTPEDRAMEAMRREYRHHPLQEYLDGLTDLRDQVNDEIASTRDAIDEAQLKERGA